MDDISAQLTQLGLNSYEARAYLALLGKDTFSATQVADLARVPRQRIYDILASLVERGLAISHPGRRGFRYSAVAPAVALQALFTKEQERFDSLQATTQHLIASLGRQYQAGRQEGSSLDYIEVLRGAVAINQRFSEIQANCEREILIFTKPPYAKPPQENDEAIELLQRHVHACSIYEFDVLQEPETRRAVTSFIEQGEEARFIKHLPLKLVIVDEEMVMFAMEDPIAGRTDLTIMIVENRQLAQLMKAGFQSYWARALTFEEACQRLDYETPVASPG